MVTNTDIISIIGTPSSLPSEHSNDSDNHHHQTASQLSSALSSLTDLEKRLSRQQLETSCCLLDTIPHRGPPYAPKLDIDVEDDCETAYERTCVDAPPPHALPLQIRIPSRDQSENRPELTCPGDIDSYNSSGVGISTSTPSKKTESNPCRGKQIRDDWREESQGHSSRGRPQYAPTLAVDIFEEYNDKNTFGMEVACKLDANILSDTSAGQGDQTGKYFYVMAVRIWDVVVIGLGLSSAACIYDLMPQGKTNGEFPYNCLASLDGQIGARRSG